MRGAVQLSNEVKRGSAAIMAREVARPELATLLCMPVTLQRIGSWCQSYGPKPAAMLMKPVKMSGLPYGNGRPV